MAGRWWAVVPAALAVLAAAASFLPWWQAGTGAVLLGGGPLRALPPDSWTGIEVLGLRTVPVGVLALVAVVAVVGGPRTGGRICAAAAGAAATACGVAALVGRGPTGAPGAWLAVAAGLGALGAARASPRTHLIRGTGPPA